MTDIFDRAMEVEELQRQDALALQARRAGLDEQASHSSALECVICDATIPRKRREAVPGVQTCIYCQEELEKATKGRMR